MNAILGLLNAIFEFGPYWDWPSYFFYLAVGILFAVLIYAANRPLARKNARGYSALHALAFLLVFCIIAFRDASVGVDSGSYVNMFLGATTLRIDWVDALTLRASVEPVYMLFQFAMRALSDNYTVLFAGQAAVIAAGLVIFSRHFFENGEASAMPLFLASNYIFFALSLTRSAMAASLLLVALCCMKKDNPAGAVCFGLLAAYTHYTMILFLPIVFIAPLMKRVITMSQTGLLITLVALVVLVNFAAIALFQTVLSSTKYSSKEMGVMNPLSYWYLFALLIVILPIRKKVVSNGAGRIALEAFLYELVLLPCTIVSGIYRVERYMMLPRLCLWGRLVESLSRDHPEARLAIKYFGFFAFLFYSLFWMSRVSSNAGFAYALVGL